MQQTMVSRAQIAQAFDTFTPAQEPAVLDPVAMVYRKSLDLDMVLILTANALVYPVTKVSVVAQCERILQVNFTPAQNLDPDTLVVLESGPAADEFHAGILHFQRLRAQSVYDYARWFQEAKEAVRQLVQPLWALRPSQAEADFALRWAMLIAARADLISVTPWRRMQPQLAPRYEDDFYHPDTRQG